MSQGAAARVLSSCRQSLENLQTGIKISLIFVILRGSVKNIKKKSHLLTNIKLESLMDFSVDFKLPSVLLVLLLYHKGVSADKFVL